MSRRTIELKIRRQDSPTAASRWEEFSIPHEPGMNVITCLQSVAELGKTADGQQVPPVAWDCNCLEEVCGACTMVINGKVRVENGHLLGVDLPLLVEQHNNQARALARGE